MIVKAMSFVNLYENLSDKAYVGFRNLNELVVKLAGPIDKLDGAANSGVGNWLEIISAFLTYQAQVMYNGEYRDDVIRVTKALQEMKLPKETYSKWLVTLLSLKWFFAGATKALKDNRVKNPSGTFERNVTSIKNLWVCSRDAKWLVLKFAIDLDRIYGSVKIEDKPLEKFESCLHISELTEAFSSFAKRGFLDIANDKAYIRELVEKELMDLIEDLSPGHP